LYGSHISQQVINKMIAPKEESHELVMKWIEDAGLSSHATTSHLSDSIIVEASISQIESLIKAEYNSFGNSPIFVKTAGFS